MFAHFSSLLVLMIDAQNIFLSSDCTSANSALSLGLRLDNIYCFLLERFLRGLDIWRIVWYFDKWDKDRLILWLSGLKEDFRKKISQNTWKVSILIFLSKMQFSLRKGKSLSFIWGLGNSFYFHSKVIDLSGQVFVPCKVLGKENELCNTN